MTSLLILLTIQIALPAMATPRVPKAAYCASILSQLRPSHSLPGTLETNNREAINELRRFRVETLRRPVVENPRAGVFSFHSDDASEKDKDRLAQEIRGIELQHEGDASNRPSLLWAQSFRGEDEIGEFFMELVSQTRERSGFYPPEMRAFFAGTTVASILGLSLNGGMLSTLIFGAGLVASGPDRHLQYYRSTFSDPIRRIEKLQFALRTADTAPWAFFSLDAEVNQLEVSQIAEGRDLYHLPKSSLQEMFKSQHIAQDMRTGIGVSLYYARSSLFERLLIAIAVKAKGLPLDSLKPAWVHTDLLASHDSKSNEPILTVVVRFNKNPPTFSRPKKQSLQDKLSDLLGSKNPIADH